MTDNTTDTTLLVTVDSLRTDHVQFMPRTLAFLDDTHDAAFATSTATPGSFPAIIGGEYPAGNGLEPTASVTHEFDAHCVGITTNHLLSAEYDYATGFDSFTSPKGGGESLKERGNRARARFASLQNRQLGLQPIPATPELRRRDREVVPARGRRRRPVSIRN